VRLIRKKLRVYDEAKVSVIGRVVGFHRELFMELDKAVKIFNQCYKNINGYSLSVKGREEYHHEGKSFIYGEVIPESFYSFLSEAKPAKGEVFYDLGSGAGKAVLLAHMLFDFSESKGVELVKPLYEASNKAKTIYTAYNNVYQYREKNINQTLSFMNENILEVDFSDADIIYLNWVTWTDELRLALQRKLALLKAGSRIVSVTLSPDSNREARYDLLNKQEYPFSWGDSTVFTSIKTTPPFKD
jgi:Histone methylation protein DOT1